MSNINKAYFVVALLFMIGLFSNCNGDGQGNKTKNIRFEKIDHFTKITDSTQLIEQVYIVHNFPLNSEAFAREAAKFLNRQPLEDYRTMYFIFIQEHEKNELPLYEDTLNYRSKGTTIEDIYMPDVLYTALKFVNEEKEIKQKISRGRFFNPNN